MTHPKGLNLQQIYDLCEEAKAKNVSALFKITVNDPVRGYKFDLIGIPESDYLFYDEPSKYMKKQIYQANAGASKGKYYFHGVKLTTIAFNTESEEARTEFKSCAEFILKRGTFRRIQKEKKNWVLKREAVITHAGKQDVLLYVSNPLNPEKVREILEGSVTLL